jgi:hypothetical protein
MVYSRQGREDRRQETGMRRQAENREWLGLSLDCQVSTVDCQLYLRDFFGNEAERLLKIKEEFWNEAKRT